MLVILFCAFLPQAEANNRANQMNPNNAAYWQSRGHNSRPADWQARTYGTYDNNRANQLNPNNDAYKKSRGYKNIAATENEEVYNVSTSQDHSSSKESTTSDKETPGIWSNSFNAIYSVFNIIPAILEYIFQ